MAEIYIGNIKGPQGETGATGATGPQGNAATVTVGSTSTTAYGNPATVTNVGTENNAILNFVIPQGRTGETVTAMDNLALNTIETATAEYPQIQVGDTGKTIFGKIIKFFQDLVSKKVDTSAVVNNFTTTESGYVADARTVHDLKESLSTKFKTHTYGSVTFAANTTQRLEVSFSIIPSTAKCVTPYFSNYSNSSELSTKFTVIKHTASWYISYTNPNPQYSANLLIDYIDA